MNTHLLEGEKNMARHHRKPRRSRRNYFWKGVKRYGFMSSLKWEFKHPRKYPQYPIWFIPMLISMVIIAIILFFHPLEYIPILFYILEIIVVSYMMFRLIKRLNRIRFKGNTLRLFGLKILSGLITVFGLFLLYFTWISFMIVPFEKLLNQESFITQIMTFGHQWQTPYIVPLGLEVIGIGLCVIGAYLLFLFKINTGHFIWVGRA